MHIVDTTHAWWKYYENVINSQDLSDIEVVGHLDIKTEWCERKEQMRTPKFLAQVKKIIKKQVWAQGVYSPLHMETMSDFGLMLGGFWVQKEINSWRKQHANKHVPGDLKPNIGQRD